MFQNIKKFSNNFDFPIAIFDMKKNKLKISNLAFDVGNQQESKEIHKIFHKIDILKFINENLSKFEYEWVLNKRKNIPFEFFINKIKSNEILIYGINLLRVKEQEYIMKAFSKMQNENELLKEKIELEALGMATTIQKSLLPTSPVHNAHFSIASFYKSALHVGGDWFNFFLEDRTANIYIGDITGHGFAPALLTAVISGIFEKHCMLAINENKKFDSPTVILKDFNETLLKMSKQSFMMTMLSLVISKDEMNVYTYSAAHNFPFVIKRSNLQNNIPLTIEALPNSGKILGSEKDLFFKGQLKGIQSGDVIFAYTDGLIEGLSKGEQIGTKKIKEILKKHFSVAYLNINDVMQNVKNEVLNMLDSRILEDDISAIAIEIL